eukprot:GEMP01029874.1.p1 GENE.GEMP01029874.1~~GEMP01029874.1.p1  ORF type:complete len:129 (+),score=29.89 GEMP01029874.1:195-581(+)
MMRAWRKCCASTVRIVFVHPTGKKTQAVVPVGTSLLEAAHQFDVPLEGACDSSMACSTCHIILPEKTFDCLPPACEDEEDMLDLAPNLEVTSRLGCQVRVTKEMEGTEVRLPAATVNFYVDGFVPEAH